MKYFCLFLLLGLIANGCPGAFVHADDGAENSIGKVTAESQFAIVTYVADPVQERSVRALIKSVRELSGEYRNVTIYVVLSDPEHCPAHGLKADRVVLLTLEMESAFRAYPLAIKAFVAAQVEKQVQNRITTLAWLDPGALALNSLAGLDLEGRFGAAVRPVSLNNTIGLAPGTPPDAYWSPIYAETRLDHRQLTPVETIVDQVKIQPYFNCEIFSVNPGLGICTEWARILTKLLQDERYQQTAATTFLKRLFLHQAVLSAVITARVPGAQIKPLALTSGYPFNQHEQLSAARKIGSLNDLSAIIFDDAWERNPNWLKKIPVSGSKQDWLFQTYLNYLQLTDHLYRIEGSCNSYLVTTAEGSVLIDPAGAAVAPEYFQQVIKDHPLKAILLTHGHPDHWENIDLWRTNANIPIIAQREFTEFIRYQDRLAGFFARRNAIWRGQPVPEAVPAPAQTPIAPTVFFADDFIFELGGVQFQMMHTPGETPDHATIRIPELRAVCVGDNYYKYFINNATFRGTSTRPVLGYIAALDTALALEPSYFLMGHGTPIIGWPSIKKTVTQFRDALQYLYDATLKGLNEGKDVYTLMQTVQLPAEYQIGQFYGKVPWTVRGICHENTGWFDENPATMYALPAASIYPDLVELAGGADAIAARAEALFSRQEYVQVLHLTEVALSADPHQRRALEVRLKALTALKANTGNYIEKIWLDYGIRKAQAEMKGR